MASFPQYLTSCTGAPIGAEVVTPSDVADLPNPARIIVVSEDCTVRVTMPAGGTVDLPMTKGQNPCCCTRVHATGTTTALPIIAQW